MPNRLSLENSPYLLQHQHNPVDWYPWGDEAFEKAKALNLPLLVSIGYSACHWCHVMERESFENAETAELMNRLFVNVKVDREERPDVDHIYMDAVQAISGSGGWPLNVFLTPEGKPFYGGTYFPPIRAYNRSSWTEVLQAIANVWREKPYEILSQADNLTEHLQNTGKFNISNANLIGFTKEVVEKASAQLLLMADKVWGGFGKAPKFPQTFSIRSLLRQSYFSSQNVGSETIIEPNELLKQASLSLDKMIGGGLFDHLQGGFARYSTDNQWLVPHFEKMLYDNALLVTALSEAFQLTQNMQYKSAIEATLLFVQQEWQDSDGGFFSAYDADSEGEEGKFYVWEYEEVLQILGDNETAQRFCKYYDISVEGNWEAKNILWTPTPIATFAAQNQLNVTDLEVQFADCRAKLLSVRSQRVFPLLDNKKILAWNNYMIQACCSAWAALNNPVYLAMAEKAAHFIEEKLQDITGGYFHNYTNGKPANPAFLDDLSAYCAANCMLHTCTGQAHYLMIAQQVMEKIISDFSDETSPMFFFTSQHQKDIIIRKIEVYDGATAAGNSVVADCLLRLGVLLNKPDWLQRASDMLAQIMPTLIKHPNSFANWLCVLQHFVYGITEVAVVGEDHLNVAQNFLESFLPNIILQHAKVENEQFPLLAGKTVGKNGETTIYVCKQYACQTPTTSFETALQQIKSFQ